MDFFFSILSQEYAKYFRYLMGTHEKYFASFVMCEFLNLFTTMFNFWITNKFLKGKFANYGFRVVQYLMLDDDLQSLVKKPGCSIFPTTVSYYE